MKIKKPRKPAEPRNMVVLGMLLATKGGPMRDRRERRPRDRRHDWSRDGW